MMVPMGMGDTFSRNFRKMNHSLKDRLIRHMEDGRYEPQSKSELARALNVDSRQKLDFRALVDQMEEEGKLVRLQKGRYALKRERRNLVHGMIRILRSGKILFLPRKGDPAAAALGWDTEAIPELELKTQPSGYCPGRGPGGRARGTQGGQGPEEYPQGPLFFPGCRHESPRGGSDGTRALPLAWRLPHRKEQAGPRAGRRRKLSVIH